MKGTAATAALILVTVLAGCDYRQPTASAAPVGASGAANTEQVADAVVAARLRAALQGDPITREADIQVSVARGRARLSGFVDSAAAKLRAGVLAAETEGVAGVDNRLIQRHHAGITPDPIRGVRMHL